MSEIPCNRFLLATSTDVIDPRESMGLGVIDAENIDLRCAELEHVGQWKCSQGELAILSVLVNRKAGRTIM